MNTDTLMTSAISTSMRERSLRVKVTVMRMSACCTGIRTIRTFTIDISGRPKVAPDLADVNDYYVEGFTAWRNYAPSRRVER
jgi:hypothetical protein